MEEMGFAFKDVRIAHWTPGRVRISFRDTEEAGHFARTIGSFRGVLSAKASALTGSVLVHYNDELEDVGKILGSIGADRGRLDLPGQDLCLKCKRSMGNVEGMEGLRRLVSLMGAILSADVIGIISWVLAASDDGLGRQDRIAA